MEYANNFTSRPTQRRSRARGSPTIPPLSPIKWCNPQSARIVHQLELSICENYSGNQQAIELAGFLLCLADMVPPNGEWYS